MRKIKTIKLDIQLFAEEQTLETKIKATADDALKSLQNVIEKLNIMTSSVDKLNKKINSGNVKTATKEIDNFANKIGKSVVSAKSLKNALSFTALKVGLKNLTSLIDDWVYETSDYSEQLNLFNVIFNNIEKNGKTTFSELGKQATQFQYKLNESFGTNKIETLYMQGMFQAMGEAVKIPDKYSAIMSETMTKLTYDMASLYNKQETDTAEALRAGVYAGQTKPLRAYGIDVTQTSMQPMLDELGIDKTVKQLSQAEKEILRYLITLRQASNAMGDFANTIESPANQLKIFKQQLVETKVAITSLIMNLVGGMLPYLNALLMVIKEVALWLGTLLGIEFSDFNSGIANYETGLDSIGDSADKASKAVAKLKRQALGFDEIHNINENTSSGSGSGNINGTGIDQKLLDAIYGYDNGMENVRMKATEIRDRIMEWLGFTKKINPITGKTYFTYNGIKATFSNITKSIQNMKTQWKALLMLGVIAFGTKVFSTFKKVTATLGEKGLLKVLISLGIPVKQLLDYTKIYTKLAGGSLVNGISAGTTAWSKQLGVLGHLKTTLVGSAGLLLSLSLLRDSLKEIEEIGEATTFSMLKLGGSIVGATASGALLGAQFGPLGAVIGSITGAVISLTDAYMNFPTSISIELNDIEETTKKINDFCDSLKEQYNLINSDVIEKSSIHDAYATLLNELDGIVDKNGKVKQGYEERANFIVNQLNDAYGTEIKIIDGKIVNYQKERNAIKDIILEKKKQIALEASENSYKLAMENKVKTYNELVKAEDNYIRVLKVHEEAQAKVNKAKEEYEASKLLGLSTEAQYALALRKANKELEDSSVKMKGAKEALDGATEAYDSNTKAIMTYTGLLSADVKMDSEKVEEYITEIENSAYNGKEYLRLTREQQEDDALRYYTAILKITKENEKNITDEVIKNAESRLNSLKTNLAEMTLNTEGELGDSLINAWGTLAETSETEFMKNFEKLPSDIQVQIIDKMQQKGVSISAELQKGINKKLPTIEVKNKIDDAKIKITADTSSAEKRTNEWLGNLVKNLGSAIGLKVSSKAIGGVYKNGVWSNIGQFANGGLPSKGSMFVAGEAGAEIVGNINGRTEVLNKSQIASAIYSAVLSAMSKIQALSQIDVYVHTDEGTVVDRINQKTKQTGQFPFIIPAY